MNAQEASSQVKISVVMGVHSESEAVRRTIQSVLAQQQIVPELVLVDDGSDKHTRAVLDGFADDGRVKLIRQDHVGLTKALIVGVENASHELIARIDAGDEMLPMRLFKQASAIEANTKLALVASHVELITGEGHTMLQVDSNQELIDSYLRNPFSSQSELPFHSSVMFRKSSYQQVGGYRWQFYFAQDFDLWSRLIETGDLHVIPEVLTRAEYTVDGISAEYKNQQQQLAELIRSAKVVRQNNGSENSVLEQAAKIRPGTKANTEASKSKSAFRGNYFIARCLSRRNSPHAGIYFKRALSARPYSLKTLVTFIAWAIRRGFGRD